MRIYRTNDACPNTPFISGRYGDDCDDTNSAISPSAIEICGNSIDEDCNGIDAPCSLHPSDTNNDGCIDIKEILEYISGWKAGIFTMNSLINELDGWKNSC